MSHATVNLTIPALGSKSLPMLPHEKVREDGSTSVSFVALPPGETETRKGFMGWTIPVGVADVGGLPTAAELTVGKGKSATTVQLELAPGSTKSGNPRRRVDASVTIGEESYRVAVQLSETKRGELYIIATAIPGGSGGGLKSDANPFA